MSSDSPARLAMAISLALAAGSASAAVPWADDEPETSPTKATSEPDSPVADEAGPTSTAPALEQPARPTSPAPSPPSSENSADRLTLISGAPLNNPNVGVHIVEMKQFSNSGKRELILFPLALQVNGKFTQHAGTMGSFVWHLHENFGLQLTGGYHWYNGESALNSELAQKVSVEAETATSLLNTWALLAGVEVAPFYGKFAFFESLLVHFSLVVTGGAGLGGTRHQLRPENIRSNGTVTPATYGDTGTRFMAGLGAGLRLLLGHRFALRVEVRDLVYTARVERVNGCSLDDLNVMTSIQSTGGRPRDAVGRVSSWCRLEAFDGNHPAAVEPPLSREADVAFARHVVGRASSDVLNNVGLYLGASFLF